MRIYLPAGRRAGGRPVPRCPVRRTPPAEPLPAARAGETILLVEDHEDVRRFGISALEGLGYRVLHAGRRAIGAAPARPAGAPRLHLLFTDVVLPGGMSGLELAEAVSKRRPALPVLLTSGHVQSLALPDGTLVAPERVLAKPYTVERLAANVRQAIDRGTVPPARRSPARIPPGRAGAGRADR